MATRGHSLLEELDGRLGDEQRVLLAGVREAAEAAGVAAFLVGGSVRDLLIGERSPDLDVTVAGDAIALARRLAAARGLRVSAVHEKFGTAKVTRGGAWLDLITARRESYAHPGALPEVSPAGIAEDLARRDFSINAMALGLTGSERGRLVDPHEGREDLTGERLRILHPQSFEDDATRLLRAARYAARFGFALEAATAGAAERSRRYLDTISPVRLRHELLRTFQEPQPVPALEAIEGMGLPGAIVVGMSFARRALDGWRRLNADGWLCLPLVWAIGALSVAEQEVPHFVDRFALTQAESRAARALPQAGAVLSELAGGGTPRPSAIVAALERLPAVSLRALSLGGGDAAIATIASRYLDELRDVRPALRSEDLKEMGVPEGPLFGAVIRRLRDARLDDPSLSLDAERRLVQDMLNAFPGA